MFDKSGKWQHGLKIVPKFTQVSSTNVLNKCVTVYRYDANLYLNIIKDTKTVTAWVYDIIKQVYYQASLPIK